MSVKKIIICCTIIIGMLVGSFFTGYIVRSRKTINSGSNESDTESFSNLITELSNTESELERYKQLYTKLREQYSELEQQLIGGGETVESISTGIGSAQNSVQTSIGISGDLESDLNGIRNSTREAIRAATKMDRAINEFAGIIKTEGTNDNGSTE